MNFINPIEVLALTDTEINQVDSNAIKKAKRRVLADIELSDDGLYQYKSQKYSKSDIESSIDQLENFEKLEFYHFVARNSDLNNFLTVGSLTFVTNFRQESIYKLPSFIEFISSYYAQSFDKVLLDAYKGSSLDLFRKVILLPELFSIVDRKIAYRGLENHLKDKIENIDVVTRGLREKETTETENSIYRVFTNVENWFDAGKLKMLPLHFQALKNQSAQSVRNLSVQIYNYFGLDELSFTVISHAMNLGLDGITAQKLQEDYEAIKDINQRRLDKEKFAPIIEKYAPVVTKLLSLSDRLKDKSFNSTGIITLIEPITFADINNTPASLEEIRDQVALALRSISISIWNDHSDINTAISVLNFALKINVSAETKEKLLTDDVDLRALKVKYKDTLYCFFCEKNLPSENSSVKKTIYKQTSRTYFPRRVQYSYKDVRVPRCKPCEEVHSKGSNILLLWILGCVVVGVILGYLADEHFILGGIVGAIVGFFIGNSQSDEQVKSKMIKAEDNISTYPPVRDLISQGWTFSKPSA